jgi:hypothetical protein
MELKMPQGDEDENEAIIGALLTIAAIIATKMLRKAKMKFNKPQEKQ